MVLKDFLVQKKSTILKRWFDRILKTYPQETQRFLQRQKDPFANPVGSTILEGIEGLYDELLKGADLAKAPFFLDTITRIRAVQDFSPSGAIAFIPFLKKIIRDELPRDTGEIHLFEDLGEFERRIDQLTLMAFDIYVACREKLYEIRVNEIKNRSAKVLERINSAYEKRQPKPNLGDGKMDPMDPLAKMKRGKII
jgi:RsbT co-antagonist protein rsbRD N-terminal domain